MRQWLEIAVICLEEMRMRVELCPHFGRLVATLFALAFLTSGGALAQAPPAQMPSARSAPPPTAYTGPNSGNASPGASGPLQLAPSQHSPRQQALPQLKAGEVALFTGARFKPDMPITSGLHWRIYADKPESNGVHRLVKEDRSAAPVFALPSGVYIVHVSFGLASAVRMVRLRDEPVREMFELPAGGLRLEGRVGDVRITPGQISFEVYKGSQFDPGDKRPIAAGVMTGDVVLAPEGTYFIVSKYGDGNAVVRSDIRIQAGKLTDVTVTHRAAAIMLKLVSRVGGEALANTEWAVLSLAGDVIAETKGAFPRLILAEGEYKVVARNDNKTYPQDIKVITGVDGEIEVMVK